MFNVYFFKILSYEAILDSFCLFLLFFDKSASWHHQILIEITNDLIDSICLEYFSRNNIYLESIEVATI